MRVHEKYTGTLKNELSKCGIAVWTLNEKLTFTRQNQSLEMLVAGNGFNFEDHSGDLILPLDYLVREPRKISALIQSRLHANKVVFARKCELKPMDKKEAVNFLDAVHILNGVNCNCHSGLYYKGELVAVASFSKGRKMNRLQPHQRSFELVRFASCAGITVAGGLTRLVRKFCIEKNAADVMTYVDKQFSNGRSFQSAGFVKHSETKPSNFLVNKKTYERIPFSDKVNPDPELYYLTQNAGNIKMIYAYHP
jgi:hypothetical protein